RLVEDALALARAQGAAGLLVRAQREAIGFFEALGFEALGSEALGSEALDPDVTGQAYPHRYWRCLDADPR
ncbi:MAG: hypothetical protein V2I63_07495, partial [Pseudomonadales bacterium]|nr:hypothetical protein [Pseudomonadales bacterium]